MHAEADRAREPRLVPMALSLGKKDSATVGLDVDGSFLAAALLDGRSIGRVASMDLPPGVTTDGEVREPEALADALRDMFTTFKLPRRVRLGVSNQQIVVRQLEMPIIDNKAERDAAVRFQAAEAIAMPLEEAILYYQPIGVTEGEDGVVRQRLLLVAARASMVDRLMEAVRGAGLRPDGIDLNAFALVRMLSDGEYPEPEGQQPARVLCHLSGMTNLAIASGSMCLFTRPLQTVWSPDDEGVVSSLSEEIRLSIDFHMAQPNARRVESIVLSGPGAGDPRLSEELGARTNLPVSVGEPLGPFGVHAVPTGEDPFRYTVAAGLAMGVD